MRKRFVLLTAIFAILTAVIFFLLYPTIRGWIIQIIEPSKLKAEHVLAFISAIIAVPLTMICNILLKRYDYFLKKREDAPYLFFAPIKRCSVSGVKRNIGNYRYQIKIGKSKEYFRCVYAKIKNTGNSTIEKCVICGQDSGLTLNTHDEVKVNFILFFSREKILRRRLKKLIHYSLFDGRGEVYKGSVILKIDIQKKEAKFIQIQ